MSQTISYSVGVLDIYTPQANTFVHAEKKQNYGDKGDIFFLFFKFFTRTLIRLNRI